MRGSLRASAAVLAIAALAFGSAACSRDAAGAPTTTTGASLVASAKSAPAAMPAPTAVAIAERKIAERKTATSLADFLPPTLDNLELQTFYDSASLPQGAAAGAYLDSTTGRSININLMPVTELKLSRAQFHDLKPGQTKESPAAFLSFEGFDVDGYQAERTDFLSGPHKSEAIVIVADKVDVTVSVQPAADPDESIALLKQLDLAGMEAFLKK
ncbi:MAG: hypothetical protein ACRELY_04945 [Polyangiaceae bacterium]